MVSLQNVWCYLNAIAPKWPMYSYDEALYTLPDLSDHKCCIIYVTALLSASMKKQAVS